MCNWYGAWFSMLALKDYPIRKALFISPVLDMKRTMENMMQIEGITLLELQRKTKKTKKFRELFVSIDFRRLKTPEIQRRRVAVHVCEPYNASRLPAGRAAFFLIRLTIRPYRIFAAILCHPTEPLRFKPPHSAALRLQQSCCGRFCVSWRISLPKSSGQSF